MESKTLRDYTNLKVVSLHMVCHSGFEVAQMFLFPGVCLVLQKEKGHFKQDQWITK